MAQPHVVLVSSPDLGHLDHLLALGNRISSVLKVQVTILAVTSSLTETETIQAANARGTCKIMELCSVNMDHMVKPDATFVSKIGARMRAMKPRVRYVMKSMKQKPRVMIVDFVGTVLMSISDLGVTARYVYFPSHDVYRHIMQSGLIPTGDGILVNIWKELQGNTLTALQDDLDLKRLVKVPVYATGPIMKFNGLTVRTENPIFEWLDKKRERSVVFVCLGNLRLSLEQTMELARGLELSGQSFLWVLRRPNGNDHQVSDDYLPEGFLDRTRGVGLMVKELAPEVEILSHRSIGGFLSHCGWSIVLQSLSKGVPIISWPLYPMQKIKAMWLTEELGVAIRMSEFPMEKVIGGQEVASLVKKILVDEDGRKIRAKAEQVKVRFERAWTRGGSSYTSLLEWGKHCLLA